MQTLGKIIFSAGIFLGSIFGYHQTVNQVVGTTAVQPINGSTFTLSGSGVTSSATSITLASFTIPQSGYKIMPSNLSSTFYLTLEPGSRTRQEVVSCTTVTQNSNGTATLSSCSRGLSPVPPYTASTTIQFAHAGGTQVIFGDAAQLFNQYAAKTNDETISAIWTFTSVDATRARIDADTDTAVSTAFVTLGQLSRQAISGASNASETTKGIVELATAIEQASSTPAGSTAALLGLRALYATSSPIKACDASSVVGALCIVVARNDGKISPNFIATSSTDTYNWGGNNTYTGLSIFTGQVNASSTTNVIASSTQYTINVGTVNATSSISVAGAKVPVVLYVANDSVGTTQTSTTTLLTYQMPANTMGLNKMLRISATFSTSYSATSLCDYNVDFGTGNATTTVSFGQIQSGSTNNFFGWGDLHVTGFSTTTSATVFTSQSSQAIGTGVTGSLVNTYSPLLTMQTPEYGYMGSARATTPLNAVSYIAFRGKLESGGSATCYVTGASIELLSQ